MNLNVMKLHPGATIPAYAHDADGCFDLYAVEDAAINSKMLIPSHAVIRTGLAFEVPEGFVMLLFSRSGMGVKQQLRLSNCVGVIDSGYHNEVLVSLQNDSNGNRSVKAGDRIAQAMIIPRPKVQFHEVESFDSNKRKSEGFGGSGQ
jgi:dUTP pyrophosphatase